MDGRFSIPTRSLRVPLDISQRLEHHGPTVGDFELG